jgi:hypothetical protein
MTALSLAPVVAALLGLRKWGTGALRLALTAAVVA